MISTNGTTTGTRTCQRLGTAAVIAGAIAGALALTAPAANSTPFGDGCIATQGRG